MSAAGIYGLLWLLVMAAAGTVYLTNSFSLATTMILGFVALVLAGAGLLTIESTNVSARDRLRNW